MQCSCDFQNSPGYKILLVLINIPSVLHVAMALLVLFDATAEELYWKAETPIILLICIRDVLCVDFLNH